MLPVVVNKFVITMLYLILSSLKRAIISTVNSTNFCLHIVFSFQNIVQVEEKMVEEKETSNTEVASSDDEEEIELEIGKFLSSMNMTVTVK